MKLVMQPNPSTICGQCCVAMVTGKSLEEVIGVFGHERSTKTKDLVKVLKYFGVSCSERLKIKRGDLPQLCIAKVRIKGRRNWHWVVYNNGLVYCPSHGIRDPTIYLIDITSYLSIL